MIAFVDLVVDIVVVVVDFVVYVVVVVVFVASLVACSWMHTFGLVVGSSVVFVAVAAVAAVVAGVTDLSWEKSLQKIFSWTIIQSSEQPCKRWLSNHVLLQRLICGVTKHCKQKFELSVVTRKVRVM